MSIPTVTRRPLPGANASKRAGIVGAHIMQERPVGGHRPATLGDAAAIAALVNAAYRPAPDGGGWTHEADLIAGDRVTLAQVEAAIVDSAVLLAFERGQLVACVQVQHHETDGHIGMLAVKPACQGTGVGKAMLTYAENYAAREFGARRLVLHVVSARAELIAFYLRRGYRRTNTLLDYPVDQGVGVPRQSGIQIEILEKLAPQAADARRA